MSNGKCCILFLLIFIRSISCVQIITIGAVFENDSNYDKSSQMLQYAIDDANENILGKTDLRLALEIEQLPYGREFAISRKVCKLLDLGIGAMFGPKSFSFAQHTINICDGKEIPYISTYMDIDVANKLNVINIYPNQDTLMLALNDVLNATGWDKVVILYESPLWLTRITPILEMNNKVGIRFLVRDLDFNATNNDFRPILQEIRDSDNWHIIVDCSIDALPVVLSQAMQVGLLTKSYRWIITNLDAYSLDLNQFGYGATNITTFQITNQAHSIIQRDKKESDKIPDNDETIDDNFDDSSNIDVTPNDDIPMYPDKFVNSIGLQECLIYDAVMIYAIALKQLGSDQIVMKSISCNNASTSWDKGDTITNFMRTTEYSGLTGDVKLDNFGVRSSVNIDILELSERCNLTSVATWKADGLDRTERLKIDRNCNPDKTMDDDKSLRKKTLKVITTLTDPYTMLKTLPETKIGNDRYEGFAVDIIIELSKLLGFDYVFILQEDGHYGKYNETTRKWNGMINEILSERADIAINDLTVTAERSKVLQFTPSILNLGIALLYQAPLKAPPSLFSFMAPLSNQIWIMLGVAYISISIIFFILGRISPAQWENPYPCVEEPTHLRNQFSFQSSMWFAAGAILQQGSEIEVKAASLRVASAFWWFFTLIMVSSYTANLAAFLVAENTIAALNSVEDFKNCGLPEDEKPECEIKFGMKEEGSTYEFFKDSTYSTYSHMFQVMQNNKHLYVKDNAAGLKKVQTEKYAYLMESTSLLYYTERYCNVTQVGDLIDDRNYAIGMRKGYKYYHALSEGVLVLQEKGILDELHKKWWKSKRGGGKCQKKETSEAESLNIDHLTGVFLIVTCGSVCALLIGIFDALRLIRRRARKAKISFRSELRVELRFLYKSLLNPDKPKPVRFFENQAQRTESTGTN